MGTRDIHLDQVDTLWTPGGLTMMENIPFSPPHVTSIRQQLIEVSYEQSLSKLMLVTIKLLFIFLDRSIMVAQCSPALLGLHLICSSVHLIC